MKRDLDLIRKMLLRIESMNCPPENASVNDFLDLCNNREMLIYQVDLLLDAGFIEAIRTMKGFIIQRITFKGCDYLDDVRDDNVWNQTKDKLKSYGGVASIEIVRYVAQGIIKAFISELGH